MSTWLAGVDLNGLVVQLGAGGLVGFVVGYAVKKLLKVFLVILGLGIVALMALSYLGVITVNWNKFLEIVSSIIPKVTEVTGPLQQIANALPFAGAFVAGFILGLKVG